MADWYIKNFGLILLCLVGLGLSAISVVLYWVGGQYG